ncbi:MAG: metallophosphoesterase [Clostridia bacterium]|nr:metallophosphoesterase [Clostridia bacterium]
MSVVRAIFSNFGAFLMCIIITLCPYKGIKLPVIDTAEDNCRLNIELISDTHLEENELFRKLFLKSALKNFNNSKANIDGIVVCGDITNYADEPSLAMFFNMIDTLTDIPVIPVAGNHDIGHAGDRDVTDITREQARDNFIRYRNEYMGRDDAVNYFSVEINGYKFIVIGDEVIDGGKWDGITMTPEQLEFLDTELADGTKDGKPVFVCCHWPLEGTNGEETVWPESGIEKDRYDIAPILEKYKNVFWISGHMHTGVKAEAIQEMYGLSSAEQINGVTYLNLPTFGIVNSFGLPWSGTGAQLEVYDGKVIFRPRNMLTNNWYENAEFEFEIA